MIPETATYRQLVNLMGLYRTDRIVRGSADGFRRTLDEFLDLSDYEMEGFSGSERQRDLSVKFHWGHDHDFGEFFLQGRMGDRHLRIVSDFIDRFGALPMSLEGKRILDIGCWTGGTSLLLCAMGAQVVAVEEVKKYAEVVHFLKTAFEISNLEILHQSLFDLTGSHFQDAFDYVLFAGVLYHLTDPVLALRICFNCLKDGGTCLLETLAIDSDQPILRYEGPSITGGGSQEDLSRSGWNWFVPSQVTLEQMLKDVGFAQITLGDDVDSRLLAVATRKSHADILRAGLSARSVR
jgi:2-polyprenyl-3-methyl-5-hydroxy-6-metoxy-1,4-benzoquinol methylase